MKKLLIILLFIIPNILFSQARKIDNVQPATLGDFNSINITIFGATTVSADNHAAFRLAIIAAVSLNKSIYIPRGIWLTDSLLIPDNITVYGEGNSSVLKFKSGAINGKNFLTIGANFKIHDLKIDGNSSNLSANVSSSGIYSYHKSNLWIENVTIINTSQHAFYCDSSDNIIVKNYTVDSVGQAAVRTYNCSNILLEDVDIKGWGVNSTVAAAITTYTHNLNGIRNVFLNRVKTYNKFKNVNFSYESGGITYQMKNVKITYCDFYSPTKGGVGISIGADTLTIFNNRIASDSSYYGIECSGSVQTITHNDLINTGIRLGTWLGMVSSNVKVKNNNILWTDSTVGLDHIIGVGGATAASGSPTTNATYEHYDISDNFLDLRLGKPGSAIVLGYYAGSRGLVKNFKVNNNKVFSRDYLPIVYFGGTNGSGNEVKGNRGYGKNDLALRDNGTYTNTIFADNFIPGGNIQPGTITNTFFPSAIFYNNRTDSTTFPQGGIIVASADYQGATSSHDVLYYYTQSNGLIGVYTISANVTVTIVSSGVLTTTVTYTDETNNVRTGTFYNITGTGTTSSGITALGPSNFLVLGEIHIYPNTLITVSTTLTVGTATYNHGTTVIKLRDGVAL